MNATRGYGLILLRAEALTLFPNRNFNITCQKNYREEPELPAYTPAPKVEDTKRVHPYSSDKLNRERNEKLRL